MDFIWFALKVIIGAFILFTIARSAYSRLIPRLEWLWLVLVAGLALTNMLVHSWFGSTINPPFYTSVLFAITLIGLDPVNSIAEEEVLHGSGLFKRGAIAVAVGTILGWLSFASVVQ
ncbi:MAG TPA: hypothetical protein VFF75_04545 [Methylophilaceae bacterium]|nr:hypothetical protein [Methylophilaceae bacterium]